MKRRYIIILLWGLWVCSLIIAAVCVEYYIDNKCTRLKKKIRRDLSCVFEGQGAGSSWDYIYTGFFDEAFSGSPVRNYKEIAIPSKPSDIDSLENRESQYESICTLYELNWGDNYPNEENEGWNIKRLRLSYRDEDCSSFDDNIIQANTIFPYQVGFELYLSNEGKLTYNVDNSVSDAFDFYTTNPKSFSADRFQKKSISRLWSKIGGCENDYYWIVENTDYNETGYLKEPIYQPEGMSYEEAKRVEPYRMGWMETYPIFRVYIAAMQGEHYMIAEKEWEVNEDRNDLLVWWSCGLTILFFSLIVPLMIVEKKSKKRKSETLYQRLCRLCNPKEFMQNYDKDKVDKANSIYKRLMETKLDDKETLMEIQDVAVSELGITLIDMEEVKELKEKVNPKRFINPYNAEKVALANELYAILSKEGLTYNEFVEVEERAKSLL